MTKTPTANAAAPAFNWELLLGICLTALLAFWILALALNRTELAFDEAQYWSWSQEPAFGYFSKPPMIAWAIGLVASVCGHAEFCVRLASPLLYTGASIFIFLAARTLYDARTGFWAALVFATLPGVSLSSQLISTDVPLLFFWTAALAAWVRLTETREWRWAVLLGGAIGLGLLSKYAMIYFFLCAGLYLACEPSARWLLKDSRVLPVVLLPILLLLPNLVWNLNNGFITFSHTAANAKWGGTLMHPFKALEFFGAQFGVFGPVLFSVLLFIAWRSVRERPAEPERMLLYFSLPVILLITCQALLSRAHANWAAVAYPAASILVTAWLLRKDWLVLLRASLILHITVLLVIAGGNMAARDLVLPGKLDPYKRVLGWRGISDATREMLSKRTYAAILTDDRWVTAELLYYLQDLETPILSWRPGSHPQDHYQLTRAYAGKPEGPALLVTLRPSADYIMRHFEAATLLDTARVPAGAKARRTVRFIALESYSGR